MLEVDNVTYVVDENLLRLGAGLVAVRKDTARFGRAPIDDILPLGILDTDWIPIVGRRGWIVITNDRHLRTRPVEAELAIQGRGKSRSTSSTCPAAISPSSFRTWTPTTSTTVRRATGGSPT